MLASALFITLDVWLKLPLATGAQVGTPLPLNGQPMTRPLFWILHLPVDLTGRG
jgi:hypothetical protein